MKRNSVAFLFLLVAFGLTSCFKYKSSSAPAINDPAPALIEKTFVFVSNQGTVNEILCYEASTATGALTLKSATPVAMLGNFTAPHPSKPFVYALADDKLVYGFSVAEDCTLTPVPNSPITLAVNNYHESLAVHPSGNFLYVAEDDNVIEGLRIDETTGELTFIPGNPFSVGADTWPMHVAFTDDGQYLYTANQGKNTISGFSVDPTTGVLTELAGSPHAGAQGAYSVVVSPDGKYVVAADREYASGWSSFSIGSSGALTHVNSINTGADGLLQSAISADGKIVIGASNWSDSLNIITLDTDTGTIAPAAAPTIAMGDEASGIAILPGNKYVVATATPAREIKVFDFSSTAATLNLVNTITLDAGSSPNSVTIGEFTY